MSVISADKTKSFVDLTLLFLSGEFAVRAKFAGKVLGVRRVILLTSIIIPRVVIPVGLGSGVVVVIGTTRVVLELLPLFLLDEEPEVLLEESLELWFDPETFLLLHSISLKFQY